MRWRRRPVSGRRAAGPRGCTSIACSPCAGSGRSRPGRCGQARSARVTSCAPSPPGWTYECAVSRCTTLRSSERKLASASPWHCPASSARSSAAGTRSSARARSARATAWTSRSTRSRRFPARVQLHHGTSQVVARVARAGDGYAQLRLSAPVVAARGDRLVLRASTTVGGGRVLDPLPPRHADPERMALVDRGDVAATIHAPVLRAGVAHLLDGEPAEIEQAGDWLYSRAWLDELASRARAQARRSRSARSRHPASGGSMGGGRRPPPRPGTTRREALPAGGQRLA